MSNLEGGEIVGQLKNKRAPFIVFFVGKILTSIFC